MNLYGRIRLDIKREQIEISAIREEVNEPVEKLKHILEPQDRNPIADSQTQRALIFVQVLCYS
jgi:hypothetical protein